jgi:transcriptional/translational regulatory protein YebC/TACO1
MMFGYAINETENYMPVSLDLAHLIMHTLADIRKEGKVMTYLCPDSKSQVTIEYNDNGTPERVDTIVVSTQHDEFDEDEESNEITIYGAPTSFGEIQKHLEAEGFEVTGAEFTYIPNDLKDVTPEERETIDKMVEKLEEFDDVQTVYTNMKPEIPADAE